MRKINSIEFVFALREFELEMFFRDDALTGDTENAAKQRRRKTLAPNLAA